MPFTRSSNRASLLLAAFVMAMLAADTNAQQSKLGTVDFPTSGSEKAQAHFLRGLAALHSFWYEEAHDEFRESTQVEPGFMMGYWGEAMAHNHPLWGEQDTEAARKVLEKIKDTQNLTVRERAYLHAVKVLYGEGGKLARDKAYSAALETIYRDYPDDLEAACFYALSLLGTVRPDDRGFLRQVQAGAIALDVYQKKPNHPGAAHYIIHAFDDPEHAILALPAARRYAEIAPEAHHAQHMPSHIFLQLGMWPEAAASNEASWAASDQWVKRKNLPISMRDYHSLHWLLYIYLQQGCYSKAEEVLALMRQSIAEFTEADDNKRRLIYRAMTYASMTAAFIVETERWDLATRLFDPLPGKAERQAATQDSFDLAQPLRIFVSGLAAAVKSAADAQKSITELRAIDKQQADTQGPPGVRISTVLEIQELEIAAVAGASKDNFNEASEIMKKATAKEESMSPPSGPPTLIKPSHELFGEILLHAGRPTEATQQFATSLLRQPNRARSLLGAARAAVQSGDTEGAAVAYANFLRQWRQGDAQLPELHEAQDYLKRAGVR